MMARIDRADRRQSDLGRGVGSLHLGEQGGASCRQPVPRRRSQSDRSARARHFGSEIPCSGRRSIRLGSSPSTALKAILLLGQRPGEVTHMRREHLVDGWWEMPGAAGSGNRLARNEERPGA